MAALHLRVEVEAEVEALHLLIVAVEVTALHLRVEVEVAALHLLIEAVVEVASLQYSREEQVKV